MRMGKKLVCLSALQKLISKHPTPQRGQSGRKRTLIKDTTICQTTAHARECCKERGGETFLNAEHCHEGSSCGRKQASPKKQVSEGCSSEARTKNQQWVPSPTSLQLSSHRADYCNHHIHLCSSRVTLHSLDTGNTSLRSVEQGLVALWGRRVTDIFI